MTANQNRIFLSPPHMSGEELERVKEAFASNFIAPLGPMLDAFEEEFAQYSGFRHCLAVNSGTSAMHLALRQLGVGSGDTVIASTLTFIGSVTPAIFLGAQPIFIDSDRETWNMDIRLLEEELETCTRRGNLPKAVIPTDLYGQCADLPRIQEILRPYGIPIIADSAEAMGATYQQSGDIEHESLGKHGPELQDIQPENREWHHSGYGATAAVYSFNGNKIITTSGGGMLASNDEALIGHARKLATQAREPVPYYEHVEIGYNYRMSNILAAIGREQLRVLDERVRRKREIFEAYKEQLSETPGIEFMPEAPHVRANRWLTVIVITPRLFGADFVDVRLALEAQNIEARPVWKPMHIQPVFRAFRVRGGTVAEDFFHRGLCLPSGTAMKQDDIDRVCDIIKRCGQYS